MNIATFFHIWADGAWKLPMAEHLVTCKNAGFPATTHYGIVGSAENRAKVREWLKARDTGPWRVCAEADEGWEAVTLDVLHEFALTAGDCALLYLHDKGSYTNHPINHSWRGDAEQKLAAEWRHRVRDLETHDGVGLHWLTPGEFGFRGCVKPFFGGNFWWATAEYVRSLPPVDKTDRFAAETWIGQGKGARMLGLRSGWPAY